MSLSASPPPPRRWLRLCLLVVVLGSMGLGTWFAWRKFESHTLTRDALRLVEQGGFAEAEPKLLAALERDPNNLDVLRAVSLGLLGGERYTEAEPILTRYCAQLPSDPQPYRLRLHARHRASSQARTDAEQFRLQERALEDGRRVLELEPDDDLTAQEVVFLALAVGRYDEADRVCRAARARRPQELYLFYLQAKASHARGAAKEAAALLDMLLLQQPQYDRAQFLRAVLYAEAHDYEKAIPLLRQVIGQDKAHRVEARYQLALALARQGQPEESRQLLTELQQRNLDEATKSSGDTNRPTVVVRRAELLLGAGKIDEAIALLNSILKEDPTFTQAHRVLASCYDQRGDAVQAAEHRRQAEK